MELYVAFCVDSGYRIFVLHERPEKALGAVGSLTASGNPPTGVWPLVLYMLMQTEHASAPPPHSVLFQFSVPAEDSYL